MEGITQFDALLLLGYAGTVFVLGAYSSRRTVGAAGYFLAEREAGPIAVGISLLVSLASSLGYVAVPAAAGRSGLVMLWSLLALPLCYPIVVHIFIPFYRRLDMVTAYEYLERRFSWRTRALASGLFIAWRTTWMGAVLYVPAMALNVGTLGRIPIFMGVIALGVFATSYTALGGLRAVLWTNKAQFVVMFGGLAVALGAVCAQTPGGWNEVLQLASASGKLNWTAPVSGWDDASWIGRIRLLLYADISIPAIVTGFTVLKLANYGADQLLVQRFLSARSTREASRGFALNCAAFAVFFALMTFTGVAFSVFAGAHRFPATLRADQVFPYYVAHHAPSGLAGLMLAGLLAAAVSSIDSGINACASAFCNDFVRPLRGTSASAGSRDTVSAARLVSVLVGASAIAIGCVVGGLGDLFEIALKVVNGFAGPLLALVVLAMFSKRASEPGVFYGALLGCAFTALLVFAGPLAGTIESAGAGPMRPLALWLRTLDVGFLWVCPLGFGVSLASGSVLDLVAPGPAGRYDTWSYWAVARVGRVRSVGALKGETTV